MARGALQRRATLAINGDAEQVPLVAPPRTIPRLALPAPAAAHVRIEPEQRDADSLPKQAAEPSDDDSEKYVKEMESDMRKAIKDRASAKVLKRPAPAVEDRADAPVLKRPAAAHAPAQAGRPKIPQPGNPVLYLGGRIYDDGKRLRCYKQIGDRVEKSIAYKGSDRQQAFQTAFEAIENDPRVKGRKV